MFDEDEHDDGEPADSPRLDVGSWTEPDRPAVSADVPPPPIGGGTLALTADGRTLWVSDADRNRLFAVDVVTHEVVQRVELHDDCEPGRVAEGPGSTVAVLCRRAGDLITVDADAGAVPRRVRICGNPRGLANDPADHAWLVACAEGTVLRVRDGEVLETISLGVELRDVVDAGPPVRVSTFRDPEVLTLDAFGSVVDRRAPTDLLLLDGDVVEFDPQRIPADPDTAAFRFVPNTARRTLPTADGGWLMLHQAAARASSVSAGASGWANGFCTPLQAGVVTRWSPDEPWPVATAMRGLVTVYDFAVDPDHDLIAAVGDQRVLFVGELPVSATVVNSCDAGTGVELGGVPTSVVFGPEGLAWVQLREPGQLVLVDPESLGVVGRIPLDSTSVADSGHEIFHRPGLAGMACVSCHPEGRDDGQRWSFDDSAPRRTQALNVGLEGGEPFHWRGEMPDMQAVFDEVHLAQLGGDLASEGHADALQRWIFALPTLQPIDADADGAIARGEAVFDELGCRQCHAGARLSNEQNVVLADYGELQVPTLRGVAFRPPFMHDGRAADLHAAVVDMVTLTAADHEVSEEALDDLVRYTASR